MHNSLKNLSRLTSRSFRLKLLIDGAETTVLGELFHASIRRLALFSWFSSRSTFSAVRQLHDAAFAQFQRYPQTTLEINKGKTQNFTLQFARQAATRKVLLFITQRDIKSVWQ